MPVTHLQTHPCKHKTQCIKAYKSLFTFYRVDILFNHTEVIWTSGIQQIVVKLFHCWEISTHLCSRYAAVSTFFSVAFCCSTKSLLPTMAPNMDVNQTV